MLASNFLPEHRQMASRREAEKGFSLLEVTIVVAILMVTLAFSIPAIQTSVRSYRLGGAVSNVNRMIQMARYVAIRQGTNACTFSDIFLGATTLRVDANCNVAVDPNEANTAFIVLPVGVTLTNVGPAPAGMPFPAPPVPVTAPFAVTFTPRGTKTAPTTTEIIYMTGFGMTYAVTVSSAGRTRSWRFDGTTWR